MNAANTNIDLSIIIPVYNEAENISGLIQEVQATFTGGPYSFEILCVDDHSADNSLIVLQALQGSVPELRILAHQKNAGQSRAIYTGSQMAKGPILCLLDGDGQNNPADMPNMLGHFQTQKPKRSLAMVGGERQNRQDTLSKRFGSWFANSVRRMILRDGCRDTGCGIKVLDRQAYLALPFFDHQHRYLPALFGRAGFEIDYLPVSHRPRLGGVSSYSNFGRLLVSFRDLIGVSWLLSRHRAPGKIEEK